jgi:hypothetical protein
MQEIKEGRVKILSFKFLLNIVTGYLLDYLMP